MQFLVISHQLLEIVWAYLLGLAMGAVYDIVRFLRKLLSPLRHRLTVANVFDIIYGVFFGASYCVFIFAASSGHFRWFTLLSVILGMFVWRALPSRLFLPLLELLATAVHRMILLLLVPFRSLWRLIGKCAAVLKNKALFRHCLKKTDKYKKQLSAEVILVKGD